MTRLGLKRSALAAMATATVLAASLAPAASAAASQGLADASEAGVHEAPVQALARQGILRGTECAPGLFCPRKPLPRWMMAVWLVRVLDRTDPAPTADSGFADVDADEWWAPHVKRLAELRITEGCAREPARYCPNGSVTRAEMASFLTRAFDLAPGPSAGFRDVNASSTHAGAIDALAASGITKGCATTGPARYCPKRSVTRAQMATFLYRAIAREPRIAFVSDMDQDAEIIATDATAVGTRLLTDNFDEDLDPSWSPDGTRIAFVSDRDGRFDLFVANADGSGPRRITSDDYREASPRWSPDGSRIAYVRVDDQLYGEDFYDIFVIDADGSGSVRLTHDDYRELAPVWSPDGSRIAYTRDTQPDQPYRDEYEILVVHADGSNPIEVAEDGHDPVWSPDGSRIAYDGFRGIHVVNADGADTRMLARGRDPSWAPAGERIAYTTSRRPAQSSGPATTSDAYTLSTTPTSAGARVDSVEPPSYEIHTINADGSGHVQVTDGRDDKFDPVWSPDGASILYTGYRDAIYVVDADGANRRQISENGLHPSWSPDSASIVYTRPGFYTASGAYEAPRFAWYERRYETFVIQADGTYLSNIADSGSTPAWGTLTGWSPDGSLVVYSNGAELFTANSDGTGSRQITDAPWGPSSWDPVLSPDGSRIAYRRGLDYGSIYVVAVDGSQPVLVISDIERFDLPVWSPDSTRLAYSTAIGYSDDPQSDHIVVVNADGTGTENLTSGHETLGEGRAVCPAWSPDGTQIAFLGSPGGESVDFEFWIMDADGSNITQITDHEADEGCPLWSPDGTRFLYLIYREVDLNEYDTDIWVMQADGTGQRMLVENAGSPVWSPDGTRIAFVSDRDGDSEIFVMEADGTGQTQLTFNNDEDLAPSWSPVPKG